MNPAQVGRQVGKLAMLPDAVQEAICNEIQQNSLSNLKKMFNNGKLDSAKTSDFLMANMDMLIRVANVAIDAAKPRKRKSAKSGTKK